MERLIAAVCVVSLLGCGGSSPAVDAAPAARPPLDLSDVEPVFAPTLTTIAGAFGVSYQIPYGTSDSATAIQDFVLSRLSEVEVRWTRRDVL